MLLSAQQQSMAELESMASGLRQAKDEADEARRAQADFFAVMSHEMRTPLNGISTSLKLMGSEQLSNEDLRMLQIAKKSAYNLESVVDHVLNYSKLQADGFENQPFDFDIREMVEGVIMILSPKATEQRSVITSQIDNDIPVTIKVDEPKLRQVLINLVSNAAKFTQSGLIDIRLNASDSKLHVAVKDTGVGIEDALQQKIFTPYWTHQKQGSQSKGTGLGLKISQEFVSIMGGELKCDSLLGYGSTFYFDIPYEAADSISEPTATSSIKTYKGSILLAEDNPTNQYLATKLLQRRGLSVTVANNGIEVLEAVPKQRFDLILMDISMPKMDGLETTQALRLEHAIDTLPIIALTAHCDESDIQRFLDAGMNDVLLKPINIAKLDSCLGTLLPLVDAPPEKPIPVTSGLPIFDVAAAELLVNNIGTSGYCTVASLYLEELETNSKAIEEYFQQANYNEVAKSAHAIHSTATTLGCLKLGAQLKQIETAIKAGDNDTALAQNNSLSELVDKSQAALTKHLASYNDK